MSRKRITPETVPTSVKNKVMNLAGSKAGKALKQIKNSIKETEQQQSTTYQFLYW